MKHGLLAIDGSPQGTQKLGPLLDGNGSFSSGPFPDFLRSKLRSQVMRGESFHVVLSLVSQAV